MDAENEGRTLFCFQNWVDMGPIQFYLGLKVGRDRDNRTIKLSQPAYFEKILDRFHMLKANSVKVPMKDRFLFASEGQSVPHDIIHF